MVQISLKCLQLTELCVDEPWHSSSANVLRKIVTNCAKLETLSLCYVDATYDDMMSIFCSDRVLVLKKLNVWMTTPHPELATEIRRHNPSITHCRTNCNEEW